MNQLNPQESLDDLQTRIDRAKRQQFKKERDELAKQMIVGIIANQGWLAFEYDIEEIQCVILFAERFMKELNK